MLEITGSFSLSRILLGLMLAALFSEIARRTGALSGSGAVASTLLGTVVFGLGGLPWAILLFSFFASSSLLSRSFEGHKREVAAAFAKGGRRDWAQVAANGGMCVIILFASALGWIPVPLAWVAFAGALSTVTADTWATELGVLSRSNPRLIISGKRVPRGRSGGISWLGSWASFAGALLIAVLAVIFLDTPLVLATILSFAGLSGSFADSFLGATVQTIYYCPSCKKETERYPEHACGTQTVHMRGWRWLSNDWVNFLSSAFGALLAASLYTVLM